MRESSTSIAKLRIIIVRVVTIVIIGGGVAKAFDESENHVFEYNHPRNCKSSEYFDTEAFVCVECDPKKYLEPSIDGLGCVCNRQSRKVGYEFDLPKCEPCQAGTTLTSDRKSCIPCRKADNFTCSCAINEVKVERETNGELLKSLRCIQCSENSYPSADGLKCIACHNATINGHVNCACPLTTHVRIEDYCFRRNEFDLMDVRSTYLVQFANDNIDSYYFRKELRLSMYLCKDGDRVACERLSNMCALTLTDKSIACKLAKSKQDDTAVWRFYETSGGPVVTNDNIIPVKYTLNKNDDNNHLNFTIATFSLNGELKYVDSPNLFCTFLSSVKFGVNVHMECKVYAKELSSREVKFFVPYLMYSDKGKTYLSALPVYAKSRQWAPLKKFFLIDNVSSYKAIPNLVDDTFKRDDELSILRYMKAMEIRIKVQNDRDGGHIFTPVIRIEYDELKKQELQENKQVKVEYRVTFVLLRKHSNNIIEIAIGILSSFAVAYSALKAWSYCKRNFNGVLTIGVVVWFFIYCLGAVSNVLLLVCISACIYTFVFYKGQTVLHMMLPAHNVERKIYIYTILALMGKIIEVLALIYRQRAISVFFMDWEQPRAIQTTTRYDSPHTSLKKLYGNRFEPDGASTRTPPPPPPPAAPAPKRRSSDAAASGTENESPRDPEAAATAAASPAPAASSIEQKHAEIIGMEDDEAAIANKLHQLPVSIWRTYFVANEWFKIQTKRRINIALQITLTLFMLEIVGLKYWTQATPELQIDVIESHKTTEKSFTLRYGVGALVYVICYCLQWIVSVLFYERYVKNRLQHFVDLCSVANISVFIFGYDYYGYYIHGRSVHGYADTDLETLISDLKKEENNLCAHRGLIPGTTNQTFIASLSSSFREIYQKLLDLQNTNENRSRRDVLASINWEKCLQTHSKIKKFLTAFVDHCFKDLDYNIKERQLLEKLCDIEMGKSDDQSTFYIDDNNTFDRVIFYGNEWTLGTFEIAIFVFAQAVAKDYILACIATLLISQLLAAVSRVNGKKNLANKTLIDERFLM